MPKQLKPNPTERSSLALTIRAGGRLYLETADGLVELTIDRRAAVRIVAPRSVQIQRDTLRDSRAA